ncbi:unnamed protein product [Rotaria magnacalcarata]|uniref:Uncharacterized protein n=1 Tax=Rotaria magnacalcarata TaxID=392030 RepID=A0A817AE04_9BILA|nr:unnamed protein product [Rotaria magnacalcarata]CAF1348223.1 unnamed protein product [Rotaria magnacalcarata]CAF1929460.1 unnamed protein product [Rotaria magnacalcarata]CAF2104290.1 unnamed protein product [Rotaria magnacalcarata]CAF2261222.1 unnamed protein product [Rotaria magnacalcarata]
MVKWPICGPKLSLCCSIISVWGITQFVLMGIFFYTQAAPLLDSFEFKEEEVKQDSFEIDLRNAYSQRAYNCWIAAFLYVGLLVFAGSQFMTNQKLLSGSTTSNPMASAFAGVTTEENGFNRQYGIQFDGE